MKRNYRKLRYFFRRLTFREKAGISVLIILLMVSIFQTYVDIKKNRIIKEKPGFVFKKIRIVYKPINRITDIVPVNCESVVPVVYTKVVSLDSLPVAEKKKKFIDMILPSVLIQNFELRQYRAFISYIKKKLEDGREILPEEQEIIDRLLDRYNADGLNELLTKMNVNPVSIVLAQAAIESGWGSSRFFVQANNLFGVWTFNKKHASKIKAKKANVYLKAYKNILESVEDYYDSINRGWAYRKFRLVRLQTDDPFLLTNHLEKYSILREKYVQRVKNIIKTNNLHKYDNCRISPDYIYQ
ncbi:mannosyl-glycoprotein endo-beta-N-acetylglucosamidase [Persephonella atlantica]|uniref:Mannosyl-glycoprotein endo-beta-N-acetylglucosamidase n=1 Tax=Persephonella atlantica TaxID=2699429 RepID=A0ABS1GEY7_9AQUI|nr:glucosaminidase domain-containing protein [Persephonella atlantica]MBK3331493.1 mannosyl-glycoprotein endo-beta-N-acetylglucosamidase [Persephonella atlantica]